MRNNASLDPGHRTLYGANLRPPAGYVFNAAVATTYSLDLETALAAPVSLALYAVESREDIQSNHLAMLEGVERIGDRLVIFADAERIQGKTGQHKRLCSLLERIVVEVAVEGGGIFHPKIWVLRFNPTQANEPIRMRLIVLSRNLTRDRSWDAALSLDGTLGDEVNETNRPLERFIRRLPGLAVDTSTDARRAHVDDIAESVIRTTWAPPDGFSNAIAFAFNGFGETQWRPEPCDRLGVISPFCDDDTMSMLADQPQDGQPVFIGRSDQLAQVSRETIERFGRVAVLDDSAASEDGEEAEEKEGAEIDETGRYGLHAKVFIAERGPETEITIGSGNATRPALLTGRNVEFFATLTGRRSDIGGIDEILGDGGFGRLTRAFVPGEPSDADESRAAAEERMRHARREICRAKLRLFCEQEKPDGASMTSWRCRLIPPKPLALTGVGSLDVWPITRGEDHGCDALKALREGRPVDLGSMPAVDLTRFLGCRITDAASDLFILFTAGLALDGLPADRDAAILRWVISDRNAFFRYLRLILSEMDDPFAAMLATQDGNGAGRWRAGNGGDDVPVLEQMVRALCQDNSRLQDIERVLSRLKAPDADIPDPVPEDFRNLWETFRDALDEQDRRNA